MNAKKQARRDRAAKRFTILSKSDFLTANIAGSSDGRFDRFDRRTRQGRLMLPAGHDADYLRYVAAKRVEAAALGISA